jgi:molecular chaperone IbpA
MSTNIVELVNQKYNDLMKRWVIGPNSYANVTRDFLDRCKKSANYPPYNIKKIDENTYCVELAVAGFGKNDLEIKLDGDVLRITGKLETLDALLEDGINQDYIFRGISSRAFTREFALSDTVVLKNATLMNGMLKVWFDAVAKPVSKPTSINID